MSSSENVSDFRRRRKKNLIKIAGNKCNICGYNKSIAALQFHHIEPELKQYGLGQKGSCHDIKKDLNQLQKCILVCANCHREIEYDTIYSKQQLYEKRIYDEEEANKLLQETEQTKTRTIKYCEKCGKQMPYSSNAKICRACYDLNRRTVERPSREELKFLIRTKPFTQIAKDYNVTDNAIRKWCDAYNLPRKKADINNYLDKDWQKI